MTPDRPGGVPGGSGSATKRTSLRRRAGVVFGTAALVLAAGFVAAVVLLQVADHDRNQLLDRFDPALEQVNAYQTALAGASTGARGYTLSGDPAFLTLYRQSVKDAAAARAKLAVDVTGGHGVRADLGSLDEIASSWQRRYLAVEVASPAKPDTANITGSTKAFALIRRHLAALEGAVSTERYRAVHDFDGALVSLAVLVGVVFLGVAVLLAAVWAALRRSVLQPLVAVVDDSRRVSGGELDHPVGVFGPAEVAELAESIEAMRSTIVEDLHAIEAAHAELTVKEQELARSNRDLEQFAYVASHDLQEPLRKVASFCQLLDDRYRDQLDDRAHQYIGFAVDGARRMQTLVNDLLAFSRVGRSRDHWAVVDLDECARSARANLEPRVEQVDGRVDVVDTLPSVLGDFPLLVALFQNLIGNSLKFRADDPPRVRIGCRRVADGWEVAVADNGIGIEPEYADRIFAIFQRLHPRDRYEGTGIGLAMCRRIVEFHGGRITVDTDAEDRSGATVRFVLPAIDDHAPPAVRPSLTNQGESP